MSIKKICDESKIELGISSNEGGWSEKLSAVELFGVLKNLLCSSKEVMCL
jgi:hypothetical protein